MYKTRTKPTKYAGRGRYQRATPEKDEQMTNTTEPTLQEQVNTLRAQLDTLRDFVQNIDTRINAFADVLEESGEMLP